MRTLAPVLSMLVASCVAPLSAVSSGTSQACAAAEAYVEHVVRQADYHGYAVVFSGADVDDQFMDDPEWRPEWHREAFNGDERRISGPPERLHRELASRRGQSAIRACPSVRALLQAKGVGFRAEAIAAGLEPNPNSLPNRLNSAEPLDAYRANIERFTLPVVSDDGTKAVLSAESRSDPATGGGHLFYLRRSGGRGWKVYGSAQTWRAG